MDAAEKTLGVGFQACECHGEGTCGTCVLTELEPGSLPKDQKDKALLRAGNVDPSNHINSCRVKARDAVGKAFFNPKRSYSTMRLAFFAEDPADVKANGLETVATMTSYKN